MENIRKSIKSILKGTADVSLGDPLFKECQPDSQRYPEKRKKDGVIPVLISNN